MMLTRLTIESLTLLSVVLMATLDKQPEVMKGTSQLAISGEWLQWGALGLLAIAVVGIFAYLNKITDMHREANESNREQWQDLTQKNIEAMNTLAQCLKERPCLEEDSRTKLKLKKRT